MRTDHEASSRELAIRELESLQKWAKEMWPIPTPLADVVRAQDLFDEIDARLTKLREVTQ